MFVYDASGKLIAEYSSQTPENPNTSYVATDTLLSVRLVTDRNGNVVSRRDFKPFGEDLAADGAARKTADNYSTSTEDKVRQRLTGYQKDIETGLDFAEARMYENRHGRFTAVDPLLASGKSANPQTFNRYTYVMNSPLVNVDPTGLQTNSSGAVSNQVIDVYVIRIPKGAGGFEHEGIRQVPANFRQIQKSARANGWTVNLKFYGGSAGGLANNDLKESLQSPDRIVIFLGHSMGLNSQDSGVMTGNVVSSTNGGPEIVQQLGITGLLTMNLANGQQFSEAIPTITSKSVIFLSCFPGADFGKVANQNLADGSTAYYESAIGNGEVDTSSNLAAATELLRSLTLQNQSIEESIADANTILEKDTNGSSPRLINVDGSEPIRLPESNPIKVVTIPIKLKGPEE